MVAIVDPTVSHEIALLYFGTLRISQGQGVCFWYYIFISRMGGWLSIEHNAFPLG